MAEQYLTIGEAATSHGTVASCGAESHVGPFARLRWGRFRWLVVVVAVNVHVRQLADNSLVTLHVAGFVGPSGSGVMPSSASLGNSPGRS